MTELEKAQRRIAQLEEQLAKAQAQLAWFRRNFFGGGKSERQDVLQMTLALEEVIDQAKKDLEKETITYERQKTKEKPRRTMPEERFAGVPVSEEVTIIPPEVQANPQLYKQIGQEERFEIDIEEPKVFKRKFILPKFIPISDPSCPPIMAEGPRRVIEGSYASAGLIAYVTVAKYLDHLPLYRQEKMFSRYQAHIPRQRFCDWIESASDLLQVIYWKIKEGLISGGYIQMDETPIRFIDPDNKKGKTTKGHFWFMTRPGAGVFVHWDPSRSKAVANTQLEGFNGVLQTDGYAGYNDFKETNRKKEKDQKPDVIRVACLAHCRRKFTDAIKEDPTRIRFVLRLIGHLYHMEKQWDEAGLTEPAQRAHLRQRDFEWPLRLLKRTVLYLREKSRPTSGLGEACQYLLGQWEDLVKICRFGHVKLDNNVVENAIRPSAIGKRNWLFIGSPEAGQRSAIMYTLILSAQRFGIDPLQYLKDLLLKLPAMTSKSDFTPLLPQNWKPA